MIKLLVIGFLATASAVAAQTRASASPGTTYYAEPSVVIAYPGDFDNAVGGALALGATINNVHSIEVDVISFKTKQGDDFTFTPLLATYKYSFVLDGNFSLMAGASAGATLEKGDYFYLPMYMNPGPGHFYSIRRTAFTSGLLGGISYTLNSHASLDANAHLLRLEKTDIVTAGNMLLVTVGVKFRF